MSLVARTDAADDASMLRLCILLLRVCLVVVVLVVGLFQATIVPVLSLEISRESGAMSARSVYPAFGILCWLCLVVAVVCVWVLLSRVRPGTVFSASSVRWVERIVVAAAVPTAASVLLSVYVYLVVEPPLDAPGLVAMALGGLGVTGALTLGAVVLRAVLRDATALVARRPVSDPPVPA